MLDTTRMLIGNTKDVTNKDLQARTLTFPFSAKISPNGSGLSSRSRLAKANIRKSASLQSSLVLCLAFFLRKKKRTVPRQNCPENRDRSHYARLHSLTTSWADGGQLPAPVTGRLSNKEKTNAFAALQERMFRHLRSKAPWTRSRRISGAVEALNAANPPRNWAASLDHLPPTSAASTTRRALPPAPCSAG